MTEDVAGTDQKGQPTRSSVTFQPADALIEVGTLKLPVRPKCVIDWDTKGRDGSPVGCRLNAYFTVKGKALGLSRLAEEDIDFRVTLQGYEK